MLLRCLHEENVSLQHSGCEAPGRAGWVKGYGNPAASHLDPSQVLAASVFLDLADEMPLALSSRLLWASCITCGMGL